MTIVYVQFTDSKQTAISSVFSCPQDAGIYSNQGELDATDSRYEAYVSSLPAFFQTGLPTS